MYINNNENQVKDIATQETAIKSENQEIEIAGIALTEEEENQIAEAIPCVSSRSFALQNSIKIMDGKLGGGFYARYIQDDVKKVGWLQLIIEYPDETCKTVILYKNGFKETSTEGDGLYTQAKPKNNNPKAIISWDGIWGTTDWYELEKYASPQMPIPGRVLWSQIRQKYEKIPVVKIDQTVSIEQLYYQMATRAVEYSKEKEYSFMNSSDRYYIPSGDFRDIALQNNYNLDDLRCTFDMNGLFIKDKGKGYQYSKKFKGSNVRFYVLRKNLTEPCGNINEDEVAEFSTDVVSSELLKIADLLEKNKIMCNEILNSENPSQAALRCTL